MEEFQKIEEQAEGRLRRLLEQRGFCRAGVTRFEEYDLYVANKNFLQAEQIITFMDMKGRLLALKPDVTLSIVKNIPGGPLPAFEKLYYVDEVYRLSRDTKEYQVLRQIGVELIGPPDDFTGVEIIDLALEALGLISDSFVLDISHLAFVSGLLESASLSFLAQKKLLAAIHTKSLHEVEAILLAEGACEEDRGRIAALCGLQGSFGRVLAKAGALVRGEQMAGAYAELCGLGAALEQSGMADRVNLDFSVVSDLDYYNGLLFLGYVEGVPSAVLSGGRYDNLMKKMNKQSCAIGFGVFLSALEGLKRQRRPRDFDTLITYPPGCDYAALLSACKKLTAQGERVRLEPDGSDLAAAGLSYGRQLRFTKDGTLEEMEPC